MNTKINSTTIYGGIEFIPDPGFPGGGSGGPGPLTHIERIARGKHAEKTVGLIGILAAASGILAPSAFAVGWCPNSWDYIITCDYCSRELTCDVSNTTIWINGTGVTLDGQGHTISYSPDTGVKVFKGNAAIRNVNILNAGPGFG